MEEKGIVSSVPPGVKGDIQGWIKLTVSLMVGNDTAMAAPRTANHHRRHTTAGKDDQHAEEEEEELGWQSVRCESVVKQLLLEGRLVLGVLWWGAEGSDIARLDVSNDGGGASGVFLVRTQLAKLLEYVGDAGDGCLTVYLLRKEKPVVRKALGMCRVKVEDVKNCVEGAMKECSGACTGAAVCSLAESEVTFLESVGERNGGRGGEGRGLRGRCHIEIHVSKEGGVSQGDFNDVTCMCNVATDAVSQHQNQQQQDHEQQGEEAVSYTHLRAHET